jgi:DNA repair protein RecO (recombination protein O)
MTTKTLGIVLRIVRYSDKSSIATIYTREFGRISYMIYGLSGKKSSLKSALFLPLSIIEITAIHQPGKDIQQLKDARIEYALNSISNDPSKNAIALFLTELLHKTLKQPEADETVFDFIKQAIQLLNEIDKGIANFHLIFMMKLTRYLGFEPNREDSKAHYFDLLNGVFLNNKPIHIHFLNAETTRSFSTVLDSDFTKMEVMDMNRSKRNDLLDGLIEYYRLHMSDFHGLNSTEVLHELFN